MAVSHEPDEVQRHLPLKCLSGPHLAECREKGNVFTCGERRYEVNVVNGTKVTEHQSLEAVVCPLGAARRAFRVTASFPASAASEKA